MTMKIIAELGFSHAGDVQRAKALVDIARIAGVNQIKTQLRCVMSCYDEAKLKQPKKSPWGNTYGEYARGRELALDAHGELREYCIAHGLDYGFSVWDNVGAEMGADIDPQFVKIPSAKIRDVGLIAMVAREYECPIIISSGAASIEDIDIAVAAIARERREMRSITIMHCCMQYPTDNENANLSVLNTLYHRYPRCNIGYSDHTRGIVAPVIAYARYPWISSVEKHITMDRAAQPWNPDNAASLEPDGLRRMCRDLRAVEVMFGDPTKRVLDCEKEDYHRITGRSA